MRVLRVVDVLTLPQVADEAAIVHYAHRVSFLVMVKRGFGGMLREPILVMLLLDFINDHVAFNRHEDVVGIAATLGSENALAKVTVIDRHPFVHNVALLRHFGSILYEPLRLPALSVYPVSLVGDLIVIGRFFLILLILRVIHLLKDLAHE